VHNAEIEYLEKYASYADQLLAEAYGTDYSVDDVEKLAESLIDLDMEKVAEMERVAEIVEAGQIQARGFADELIKIAGQNFFEKVALTRMGKILLSGGAKDIKDAAKIMKKHGRNVSPKSLKKYFNEAKAAGNVNKSVAKKGVKGSSGVISKARVKKEKLVKGYNKAEGKLKPGEEFYQKKVYKSVDLKKNGKPKMRAKAVSRGERIGNLKNSKAGQQLERNRSASKADQFRKEDAYNYSKKNGTDFSSSSSSSSFKNSTNSKKQEGKYNFDSFKKDVKGNWANSKSFAKKNPWAVGAGVGAAGAGGYALNSK